MNAANEDELFRQVRDVVVAALIDVEPERIQPETEISAELGADSLDYVDIFARLEKLWPQPLDLTQWAENERAGFEPRFTVGALVAHLRSRTGDAADS